MPLTADVTVSVWGRGPRAGRGPPGPTVAIWPGRPGASGLPRPLPRLSVEPPPWPSGATCSPPGGSRSGAPGPAHGSDGADLTARVPPQTARRIRIRRRPVRAAGDGFGVQDPTAPLPAVGGPAYPIRCHRFGEQPACSAPPRPRPTAPHPPRPRRPGQSPSGMSGRTTPNMRIEPAPAIVMVRPGRGAWMIVPFPT